MLKNLKKVAAIVLSFAMAVQFGLADSYYVNAVEEPVEPQQQEETTTTAPQEQEQVPTTEEETPQQQEEGQQQPAVEEEEQPAAEEAQPQPQPVEQAKVNVSYVKEDDTYLMESVTATYDVGYRLDQDTNVFKEAHEAFEFEYAFVNGNKENKITKDQVKASGLTVTSDMTSLTLVYKEKASTEKPKKANKQEPAKTETTSESDDASDADTTESQETAVQLTEFFVVASQNQVTKGETAQLTLTIKPDNYPNKDVTWSSSNDATATVDGNGLVTTHEVGTVTITATLKSDPTISSSVTIVVNPIKVSKITVNGYGKDYLVKGDTVTLTTTVEPSDAADKSIVWSSSNEEVAKVDQNGKVTAEGQGTVSIKAMNDESGVYGEQVITVYDNTPITKRVNVWVTNESQGVSYQFNIPVNGTEVSPSQVARNTTKGDKTLVSTAQFRVLNNTVAQQRVWATISSVPIVKSFKYNQKRKKVEYTTDGQTWKTISSDEQIYDFTSMQWTGTDNNTDVKVAVGDWPYGAGVATSHNKQTIQIIVLNTENNDAQVYNSGVMRYDNGSNGNYGKIYFDCDTSKFEVSKVEVYKNNNLINSYKGSEIPKLINVQFQSYQTNKYVVKAYIKAKTIHVNYDANNGTGVPQATTVKSIEKITVDSTTRPTRVGYIFTGWTYGGKLYQGGESFDAPTSDVTFVAQWVKASEVINYTVNDSKMGSVSRSYERIGETVQGIVQGSTAIAKTGYRFVKWVKDTNPNGDAVSTEVLYKPTTEGTYMAVFEAVTSDLVIRYEDTEKKAISAIETKSYKYGESYTVKAKEIPGYRLISQATITGTKGVAREEIRFIYEAIPVIVTIKGKTDSKVYTGNPQKVEGFEVESIKDDKGNSISGYSENDVALAEGKTAVAEGTDVGTYNMGLTTESFVNTNTNFKNVTFVVEDGSMTITQNTAEVTVTITGSEETKVYNGSEQTLEGFKATVSGAEKAQIQVSLKAGKTAQAKGTSAGKYSMNLKAEDFEATSDNYSNIQVVVAKDGTLTIDKAKAKVTVKGNKDSKPYNGKDQSVSGYSLVSIDNDLYKESYFTLKEGKGTATRKNAGTTTMGLKSEDFQNRNDNFDVEFVVAEDGSMTITQKSVIPDGPNTPEEKKTGINVTAPKDTTYSGHEQKKEPVIVDTNTGKTLDKDDYSLSYSDDVTNAGTVTITVTGKGNYTGKFEVIYKINPRKVTLKSETASKPYDGTVLTKPVVKVSGDGFVEGEVSDIKATGSVTTVSEGEVTNKIIFTKKTDYKDDNYKIEREEGKLSITAKSIVPDDKDTPESEKTGITVSEPSDSKYDGKEHKEVLTVTDTKTGKELVAGTDYSVTYSSDLVNAGTVTIKVAGLGNYTGSFEKTYKITKRSVTLTSATVSKVYDGSALTNTSITVSGDGFVEGEGASYEVTGSQTEVGNSANAFEYKLNEKTLASNYNITKVVGTLTITAAPAPVTPATPSTPSTPSSTTSTTPRTLSAPQVTTPVETVEKETTPKAEPKKEEKVEEEYTPKASPQYYWALINLICAILTVLFGLLLLISKRHKSEDDDEEDDETKQQTTNDDEEKEQEKKRGLFTRVLAVLIAIVSVVFFLVTEDLSLPWTWTDQWTIWMVVIGLVQIVVFFVGRKWKNVDNDDEDEEAQQA
ncbi:MAG: Ig-like domain-containing protein [Holdemanella porci]|uniref:Ig-like domain-containing protein n=1 Tax=Holdemanella porci TaxID=2652276 RepID=UPI00242F6C5C|nr:Ig-like domain-containing protein [Holdemanella porci]MDD6453353.1 Ig-like domain-containing protein [Holdemanella porci]